MGQARKERIDHESFIAQKRSQSESITEAQQIEADSASGLQPEIDRLAVRAVGRDTTAVEKQLKLIEKQKAHRLQHENLARLKSPIDEALAKAEVALPRFIQNETAESVAELPALHAPHSETIREFVEGVATESEKIDSVVNSAISAAMPIVNPDGRAHDFEAKLRGAFLFDLRLQLATRFQAHGLRVLDVPRFSDADSPTLPRLLADLSALLDSEIYRDRVTDGRSFFRATTNISSIHGRYMKNGEVISLKSDDAEARKLISLGAMEVVADSASEAA